MPPEAYINRIIELVLCEGELVAGVVIDARPISNTHLRASWYLIAWTVLALAGGTLIPDSILTTSLLVFSLDFILEFGKLPLQHEFARFESV